MRGCYGRDAGGIVEMADAFAAPGREGMKRFLLYAMHMVRQCILLNYGAEPLVRMTQRERDFAQRFAPFIHHGNVLDVQSLMEEAHRDVGGNVNGKLIFMDLSIRMNTLLRREM
jgi:DNA polymerase-3 subunit delta'